MSKTQKFWVYFSINFFDDHIFFLVGYTDNLNPEEPMDDLRDADQAYVWDVEDMDKYFLQDACGGIVFHPDLKSQILKYVPEKGQLRIREIHTNDITAFRVRYEFEGTEDELLLFFQRLGKFTKNLLNHPEQYIQTRKEVA